MGKQLSFAALPLALSSMFTKAYGQGSTTPVNDVLNFALTLEYLEYHFYNHTIVGKDPNSAVKDVTFNFPNPTAQQAITTIRDHELAHVNLLKEALGSNARPALAYTNFDFRAGGTYDANNNYQMGGTFADVYTNYATWLKVATAFEDTGVRAYKGQAPALKGNPVLTTALQIHSVEARHASHLRQMVNAAGIPLKPWITYAANGNDTKVEAANAVYAGEQNTTQAGVEITNIAPGVTQAAAAESFDEFLTKAQVVTIANLFIKPAFKLS
ncbi:ferritin-like domain-containing protein [Niabella ginsengisoli]|uniref:Ferritin-like domain-containing protein n=1 Tax=Niabella ginsengisoli TaxID=522298 RepID=A0ABS9SJM4_9BACT|nr:ferritin-like domain-containing protein [Niabella ginsengisoli]MCH5598525.1 ferritin-like domain-containing protein [Niabella ginsengisoli]